MIYMKDIFCSKIWQGEGGQFECLQLGKFLNSKSFIYLVVFQKNF